MNKAPAFQFYANDWLSSTTIAMMSAEQERGYLRLLLHCWASGDCSLPDDDEALARLSLMGEGWLKFGCPLVRDCFTQHPTKQGYLTNEKLYAVWQTQLEWRAKSSKGGRRSAAKRRATRNAATTCGVNQTSTTLGTKPSTKRQPNVNQHPNQKASLQSSVFSLIDSPSENPPIVPQARNGKSRKTPNTATYPDCFEAWWSAYPNLRKSAKPEALRRYCEAIARIRELKNFTDQQAEEWLLDVTKQFSASPKGQGEYCPMPTTWLHQGRYEDDPAAWGCFPSESVSTTSLVAGQLNFTEADL
jgi:uncharacterized protein YdaU (DUF1376 family)